MKKTTATIKLTYIDTNRDDIQNIINKQENSEGIQFDFQKIKGGVKIDIYWNTTTDYQENYDNKKNIVDKIVKMYQDRNVFADVKYHTQSDSIEENIKLYEFKI